MVYQNGVELGDVQKGVQVYTLTGLAPKTDYTLRIRTYDVTGNANSTFISSTASTTALPGAPAANFTANVTTGYAPLTVQFTDTSTGAPTSWSWTFDDGTTATDQHPAHTYTAAGTYTVALNVENPNGSDNKVKVTYISVTSRPIVIIPGSNGTATDPNGDGLYDDINGNSRQDFADVVLYFNQMTWIAANEPLTAFDYNGNGRIDFADVVWLFNRLGGPIVTATPMPRGNISGFVMNITGGQKVSWTIADPRITINIYRKEGSTYTGVYSRPVDANGSILVHAASDAWGIYRVEEVVSCRL